jgi:hypothetical protein
MLARLAFTLRSDRGFTLIELLVAMITGLIVSGALLAIIEFSQRQETRISDHVQADRSGRVSAERIQEELHSSCLGDMSPIQGFTSGRTYTELEALNGHNLWFVSTFGVGANAGYGALEEGYLHDINWKEAATLSNTNEKVGTLTDYSFKNTNSKLPFEFTTTLSPSTATSHRVLATNVTPPEEGTTLFHYYKYNTSTGALEKLKATELPPANEEAADKIAQVQLEYQQAPESRAGQQADTRPGHTTAVSASVVLRFSPSETTEEGTDTCA